MKKKNINWFLLSGLIILSLLSFIYLNTVNIEQLPTGPTVEEVRDSEEALEEEHQQSSELVLPDLELVKKLIERSKDILSKSI